MPHNPARQALYTLKQLEQEIDNARLYIDQMRLAHEHERSLYEAHLNHLRRILKCPDEYALEEWAKSIAPTR